jgi:FAD/FMN-containing dehydrogenase
MAECQIAISQWNASPNKMPMMRPNKAAFDPHEIMNPDKILRAGAPC